MVAMGEAAVEAARLQQRMLGLFAMLAVGALPGVITMCVDLPALMGMFIRPEFAAAGGQFVAK
jgi:hypothetical protein